MADKNAERDHDRIRALEQRMEQIERVLPPPPKTKLCRRCRWFVLDDAPCGKGRHTFETASGCEDHAEGGR
jgi:hypothetical protein